ncbi:MAG: hypothetical protein AAGB00_07645 [Planctomycetota bacterium]
MPHVVVVAPSRLHFGLSAFADSPHAFGGCGVMIDEPRLVLTIEDADEPTAAGPLAGRIDAFMGAAAPLLGGRKPRCRVSAPSPPPEHAGLGLGTQLGLSVAAGIAAWARGGVRPAVELAEAVGRGRRSAVGTHGFEHGGLILDGGRPACHAIGRLERRVVMPESWRVLLVTPVAEEGLSGEREAAAFDGVGGIPPDLTVQLRALAARLADAAASSDFDSFASALGEYGRRAGECFSAVQGGPFASPQIAALIARLNRLGAAGAGQSSWGPTVFAPAPSRAAASELRDALLAQAGPPVLSARVTRFNNTGAVVRVMEGPGEEPFLL